MNIQNILKSLFSEPCVATGTKVNHARQGCVIRQDGVVVGSVAEGALVEWPIGGSSLVPHDELAIIGG